MRKHYLDTLRVGTIFIVIIMHILLLYSNPNMPYYIKAGFSNDLLTIIISAFLVWLMPLLFTIAGITSYYSLKKRDVKGYFKERVSRLLIPFISSMILLNPILSYFGMKFHENLSVGFFNYYLTSFTFIDSSGFEGGLTLGPAWFILFLFLVSVIAVPFIKRFELTNKDFSIPSIVLIGLIPTLLFPILNLGDYMGAGKSIAVYLAFFLLGYYVLANDNVMEKLEKNKIIIGLLTLLLTVVYFIGCITANIIFVSIFSYYVVFFGWICILFLLTLGKIYLNKTNNIAQYLSESSFSIYIFHEPILIAIAFYMIQFTSDIFIQMISILLLTIPITLGVYTICKKFKVTKFLFGIK